jgi:hypothetical protein
VWINVKRRGLGEVHECQVNDYEGKGWRESIEQIEWPNTAEHAEMQAIDELKEEKINRGLSEMQDDDAEQIDPEEVAREEQIKIAQRLRTSDDLDLSGRDIAELMNKSHSWVYDNTDPANNAGRKEAGDK